MVLFILAVTACAPSSGPPQAITETFSLTTTPTLPLPTPTLKVWHYTEMTIGLIQASLGGEWQKATGAEFMEFAERLGIILKVFDAKSSPAAQFTAFRTFIQDALVDAIVIDAIERTGWEDLLKQSQAAGKVVIFIDQEVDAPRDLYTTYISSNFFQEGQTAAFVMCRLLIDSKKTGLELSGNTEGPDAFKYIQRSLGFRDGTRVCGVTVIQLLYANLYGQGGEAVVEDTLRHNTDIQAVFAQNKDLALTAVQAIKKIGLKPGVDIKIMTIDVSPLYFQTLPGDEISFCIDHSALIGPSAFDAAQKALSGEKLPGQISLEADNYFYFQDGQWWRAYTHSSP
jgi:galactofuranose transport system substrate-binding protein